MHTGDDHCRKLRNQRLENDMKVPTRRKMYVKDRFDPSERSEAILRKTIANQESRLIRQRSGST